jgi:hypothetical protein
MLTQPAPIATNANIMVKAYKQLLGATCFSKHTKTLFSKPCSLASKGTHYVHNTQFKLNY